VVNIEDVDNVAVLIDPVDDAISAAPGAVTTGQWPEQRLANPLRVDRQGGIAETPERRRPRLPGAARQSLAVRQAGSGSRTAAQVRSSRASDAAPGQILANSGRVSARLTTP
jgi:hypothetical protein